MNRHKLSSHNAIQTPRMSASSPHPETVPTAPLSPKYGGFTRFEIELEVPPQFINPISYIYLNYPHLVPRNSVAQHKLTNLRHPFHSSSKPSTTPCISST